MQYTVSCSNEVVCFKCVRVGQNLALYTKWKSFFLDRSSQKKHTTLSFLQMPHMNGPLLFLFTLILSLRLTLVPEEITMASLRLSSSATSCKSTGHWVSNNPCEDHLHVCATNCPPEELSQVVTFSGSSPASVA